MPKVIAHVPKIYWIFLGPLTQVVKKAVKLTPEWQKMSTFLRFSNPLNQFQYMPKVIAHIPKVYWIFLGTLTKGAKKVLKLTPGNSKNEQFSRFSNPSNQTHYMPMVFAHAQKVSLIFWGWVTQAVFRE